jgi:molybdopterin-guanine dinucleotide biosynthesis protein A
MAVPAGFFTATISVVLSQKPCCLSLISRKSFSLREKVAEGRMRGQQCRIRQLCPLTLTLSLRERELYNRYRWGLVLVRKTFDSAGEPSTIEVMADSSFDDMTAVILVGGKSRRMGEDKAFLEIEGVPLFERVLAVCREVFARVILIGGQGARFAGYGLPVHPDIYPGSALGGLYTGLVQAGTPYVFAAACDLPFPSSTVARHLASLRDGFDAVVPRSAEGFEPLFAVYARTCLEPMRRLLEQGNFRIYDLYTELNVRYVPMDELARLAGDERALVNVNTPEEFALARGKAGRPDRTD